MAAGLYIHVPYCTSKCSYCAFYSLPPRSTTDMYLRALADEYLSRRLEIDAPFTTVYIGGGTPSLLSEHEFGEICSLFADEKPVEFTIEVNPDDVTLSKARFWREMGVNRISMGVQSLDDKMLQTIGRRHDAAQAVEAFHTLRKAGFNNISIDAIMGLPGQTMAAWHDTLVRMIALQPEHISSYILEYEKGSRLSAALQTGRIQATDDDTVAGMYKLLCQELAKAGFEHYEISNFALPGHRSLHNSSYWRDVPYLGIGPAAHSFDGILRRVNPPSLQKWLDGQRGIPEPETETERLNDSLMTALRTVEGFDYTRLNPKRKAEMASALVHIPASAIENDGTHIRIKEHSWLIADAITSTLFFD